MKVALICIGRTENQYIREFVEYYKDLGVDKIFLYDNNHDGEECFEEVIQDYADNGFVSIVNYRNKRRCQNQAYKECYEREKDNYDWFIICDIDEFLEFVRPINVKEFLSDEKFNGFGSIHIHWMYFDDNGLVRNDGRPLMERFKKPHLPLADKNRYDYPINSYIKTILRGGMENVDFSGNSHYFMGNFKSCTASGVECSSMAFIMSPIDYRVAYFKHYMYKTIDEFLTNKLKRGYPDYAKLPNIEESIRGFFLLNEKTKEKEDFIRGYFNN